MKYFRTLCVLIAAALATGCSGIVHQMPEANELEEARALAEINAYPLPINKQAISATDAETMLYRVYERLAPEGRSVCEYVGEQDKCWWDVEYSDDSSLNAYANQDNHIVVHHGVMMYAESEDELAMVLAHEMGHHIAEHISESKTRAMIGGVAAGLLMAVAAANSAPCYNYACQQNQQQAIRNVVAGGAAIGSLTYSVAQEKEADFLSAYILNRAGYDLLESRNILVKMGAMSDDKETSLMDTHPAGPDRLATYDRVIGEVIADADGFPNKKM